MKWVNSNAWINSFMKMTKWQRLIDSIVNITFFSKQNIYCKIYLSAFSQKYTAVIVNIKTRIKVPIIIPISSSLSLLEFPWSFPGITSLLIFWSFHRWSQVSFAKFALLKKRLKIQQTFILPPAHDSTFSCTAELNISQCRLIW